MSNIVWAATGSMEWLREYVWSCFSHVIRDFFGRLINVGLVSWAQINKNPYNATPKIPCWDQLKTEYESRP